MIRVLHLLEASGGGAARHVIDLTEGLARKGVEVHLVYSPLRMDQVMREGLKRLAQLGVRTQELPMKRPPHPKDAFALAHIWRYLRTEGPFHLIHAHSSKAGGLARLLRPWVRVPLIYNPHQFVTLSSSLSPLERQVYGLAERMLSRWTDALIACSQMEVEEAHRLGYPKGRVYLVHNGIPLHLPHLPPRDEVRKMLGVEDEALVVGFVGRLVPQKNPHLLFRAFARVAPTFPRARLVMVGEGPFAGELRALAKGLGLGDRVVFAGFFPGRVAMRAFDVYALTSNHEGFAYTLIEALAEGLPIVSTRVGGAEEAISEGENGFVLPVGDEEALANALACLLADENLRRRFAEASRRRAHLFDLEGMIDKTWTLYQVLAFTSMK